MIEQTDSRTEFLLKEYEALRAEVLARLNELWQLEKFAFGGAAALAAWLLTNRVVSQWAWWLPALFLTVCAIRFASGMYHLGRRSADYVAGREIEFLGDVGGWETWFKKQPVNETLAYGIAWIVAIALAISFAIARPAVSDKVGAVRRTSTRQSRQLELPLCCFPSLHSPGYSPSKHSLVERA